MCYKTFISSLFVCFNKLCVTKERIAINYMRYTANTSTYLSPSVLNFVSNFLLWWIIQEYVAIILVVLQFSCFYVFIYLSLHCLPVIFHNFVTICCASTCNQFYTLDKYCSLHCLQVHFNFLLYISYKNI